MSSRIMIASTGSGRGKTTISSALMYILKSRAYKVHAFKCGPDFIDPLYHESILGIPSKNLDSYFCDEELLKASYKDGEGDINIIEACMGLYDGIGVSMRASSLSVATAIQCPIILVVDAYGMGASIIAEIKGFLSMDTEGLIKAVLLNRVSKSYYEKLKPVIEESCNIKLVGYCPKMEDKKFKSRHLGLLLPGENNARKNIADMAAELEQTMDIELIMQLAEEAENITSNKSLKEYVKWNLAGKTIAVAKDEAFLFYYDDNLKALEYSGARVIYFSPINDKVIPDGVDAIYIGGGYPELHTKALSNNHSMLNSIRDFIENNGYVYAECGGFMYLNKAIDGVPMVGIFDGNAKRQKGLRRFGYIEASYMEYKLKGHEFHHYDVEDPGSEFSIVKASDLSCYKAVRRYKNCMAGYPHFYFFSS